MSEASAAGTSRAAPTVLAFDTAASACSVAVACADAVLAHERIEMRHGHAEALLPMIDRLMEAAGCAASEIDIVALTVGPGGFTGIRAGLAAAHGLTLATRARLVGVTGFLAVAASVPPNDDAILVVLDSRREDLYVQLFAGSGRELGEPAAVLPDTLGRFVAGSIGDKALRIAGDAAESAAAAFASRPNVTIVRGVVPDALGVLAALRRWPECADLAARPLYLRPPDVSFPKARG